MKKYTIITKDGSKWLQPINVPYPYIGFHPDGTVLSEEGVREVRQYRLRGTDHWFHPNDSEYKSHELDVRTVYTDAESHDRHIRPFKTHNVRPLVNQLVGEEISFSRFIELLNEIVNELR